HRAPPAVLLRHSTFVIGHFSLPQESLPMTAPSTVPAPEEPWIEVTGSRDLAAWLAEQQVSLAFTTYQTGKLFLLGRHLDGRLAVVERTFNGCMGLWADGQTLWASTLYQLWRFENLPHPGELYRDTTSSTFPRSVTRPATWTSTTWPSTATGGWYSSPPCSAAWPPWRSATVLLRCGARPC